MLPNPLSASLDLLNILLNYASQLGIAEQNIAAGCGVDLSDYNAEQERIPIHKFHAVWRFILKESDDPDFGLHFGEKSHALLTRHLLYAMMMNCKNVAQAIQKNFQYHNLIMDIIRPEIKVGKNRACLTWKMNHTELTGERHFSESVLSLFMSMMRFLTEDQFRIQEVRFTHPCPENTAEHERIFSAPLAFKQKSNEVVFDSSCLDIPILLANSNILEDLEKLVQKAIHRAYALNSVAEKVSQIIFKAILQEKKSDIGTIAGHLAMTARTIQMKLKEEGTSFRKLLDRARKEIAVAYLKDAGASISEVALLLGFSDQSAFQHAFKRWTGETPGNYRKNEGTGL